MENHSIIKKCANQPVSLSNADVNFNAGMQKCKEQSVQPIPGAKKNYSRTVETICARHLAAAISMGSAQAEDGIIFPLYDSGCSTVLTSSMLNCREVEEQVTPITQAEAGVQMESTHKCRKTYYVESRDGNIHALEFDALIVPSLKQKLIGGRAVTNGLNLQVIFDKNPNICGIVPRINGKLCDIEQSIPSISDDLRFKTLYRIKTLHLAHHSL